MSETTATIVERFYAAWNGHDASAVARSFTAGGVYADPLTGDGLSGDELRDHVQSVLNVLRDLRIAGIGACEKPHSIAEQYRD
jgi:hypothetical protein